MLHRSLSILILLLVAALPALAHRGHRAEFRIAADTAGVAVTVQIATRELDHALEELRFCSDSLAPELCAAFYVQQTTQWSVNGSRRSLELTSASRTSSFTTLIFLVDVAAAQIRTLSVTASCFVDHDPLFQNLVTINLGSEERYALTKDHPTCMYTAP